MKSYFVKRIIATGCLLVSLVAPLRAAEDVDAFLAALREQGYHEVALNYLDKMANSPLAPDTFKELVLYEKGVTMVAASRLYGDVSVREKQLNKAQEVFKQFISQRATHPKVADANTQLANLTVERARLKLEQARKNKDNDSQREAYRTEARELYDEARKVFEATAETIRVELKGIPNALPPKDPRIARRRFLRAEFLQAKVLASAIKEEKADSFDVGSKQYNDTLIAAAAEYKGIYETYRTRIAGLYARLYQGRCYVKVKDYKEALSYLSDLLQQPDEPALRQLRTKTLVLAAKCWMNDPQPKYAEAISQLEPFIDSANPVEEQHPDFLSMKLSLARAYLFRAADAKKDNPKSPEIRRSREAARKLVTLVAKIPSPHQKEAQQLRAELPGAIPNKKGEPDPKNFTEAKAVAKEFMDAMQAASVARPKLKAQIAAAADQATRDQLQKKYDEAVQALPASRNNAVKYFNLALQFADDETPIADMNVVQYYLCYLYYTQDYYHDAAVIGNLVARRYPRSNGARSCANITLASYHRLFYDEMKAARKALAEENSNSQGPPKKLDPNVAQFEFDRLVSISEYIVEKWPDQNEGIEARNLLVKLMVSRQQIDKALSYLQDIPVDSSHRGQAELDTGLAIWSVYLTKLDKLLGVKKTAGELGKNVDQWVLDAKAGNPPAGVDLAEQKADLAKLRQRLAELTDDADILKQKAEETLTNGVDRMKASGGVSEALASAALSMAQIYVSTERAAEAVAILEEPKFGALSLIKQGHQAASSSVFVSETYKAALQAYISSLATTDKSDETIEKTKEIMAAMKAGAGDDPEDKKKLVNTYVSLARGLEYQIKHASSDKEKDNLRKGFETFLLEVGSTASEFDFLNWVAATLDSLGKTVDSDEKGLPEEAKRFYGQSTRIYQKILDNSSGAFELTPAQKLQLRTRLAIALAHAREFSKAISAFESILLDPQYNRRLDVQIEAAMTYQRWGIHSTKQVLPKNKERTYFELAMFGAKRDKRKTVDGKSNRNFNQNTIWGWVKISKMSSSAMNRTEQRSKEGKARWESFHNTYHTARYNIARSHYQLAIKKGEAGLRAEKKENLALAKDDIRRIKGSFPNMGGDSWQPKYNAQMKLVQKAMGQRQTGLSELK